MSKFSDIVAVLYQENKKYINKRTMQGGALVVALCMLSTMAYVESPAKATRSVELEPASTAGAFYAVSNIELSAQQSELVYAASDVTVVSATTDQVEPDGNDKYDQWADKVMADVDEYLYIRAEADASSEAIGKLRAGDVATLVDVFDGWYEIESGNAHGFVSADYCITGIEAYEHALDVCDSYATTGVAGLRIRSEASEDSKILKVVPQGTKLTVNTDAEEVEGWISVSYEGNTGYVKSDYVQVDMATGEAITLEEEAAAIAAAEEAKAAAAAAAEQAKQEAAAKAASNQTVIASADDITLLAAIIQIEAGSEIYEGQVAVGAVVMNRVYSGSYANSVNGVIFQRGQFATSRMSAVIAKGPKASCIQAAQEAMAGSDPTGGLTHFRRAGSKEGLVIGNHVFY
ncbi:SH3 domain-containing protein [Pseudobutyrivibrio sp. NOR37]|uniref:SH3 domain-containing protein n=1 Tax=Pseudobutyrivibrio xylanivorans TaxID=185007 RepID=A0A6M0LM16_PSEXY|nr:MULTISPECIES: SH3 domain-containing protein [Pseudobutyrivibrio]NEX01891.1 SH3 domain-containing protein [Pseudobutyrivibrio xylanivorans]SFR72577.1 SH3 domain-containing protein [Pseudobutyrivibrio sp. NOR37]